MKQFKKLVLNIYDKHKKAILFWCVAAASVGMIFKGLMQLPQIREGRAEIASYQSKIEEEHNRRAEIEDLSTKVNTDEYIERVASEKLGLVKSNATIFYDVSDTE